MTIQLASDLHLEFPDNRDYIQDFPLIPTGEILILAGDIVPFVKLDEHQDFFTWLADHFSTTWWIPGNHEYYGGDITGREGTFCESIRSNVFLVNNFSTTVNQTRLIFSTLWSKIRPENEWAVWQGLNDFRCIKNGDGPFTVAAFNELHQHAIDFISQELFKPFDGKTVVATHHVPTLLQYPEQYKRDRLNEAFAVELSDLILDGNPDYWMFGHHHFNQDGFTLGNTQMLTNQVGYVGRNEHVKFSHNYTINI